MSENFEKIGRAVVTGQRQEGRFIVKELASEIVDSPLPPGSPEARAVVEALSQTLTSKGRRKPYNIKGRQNFTEL